ncbi:probable serine/threonine-protein kinase zyg-1 [Oppia nitens]|uniref:probable serine/threonine-protein kinase zyg-1 n=1 Tax=Oppia nitens TaxID=1686743 RepID=UPI0023DCD667|nr:probable serine/threonine-protein kinase zyg-1 [Oppia nitens]
MNVWFVTNDDLVYTFGNNTYGKLGLGHNLIVNKPEIIPELCAKNVQKFINGDRFALCITFDQQIYSFGSNECKQLGRHTISNDNNKPAIITYLSDKCIIDIKCGSYHSLALSSAGTVYGWGHNNRGQSGCGQQQQQQQTLDCIDSPTHESQKIHILEEVKQLQKLQSKFVVKFYDTWIESKILYIQMELLSNSLKDLIELKAKTFQRKTSEPMDCIEYYITSHIMLEMCECVEYLHTRQPPVIHRDLKPANILINDKPLDNRFLKLCDFGLATDHNRMGSESELHTKNVGTDKYMAQEVREYNGIDRVAYNEKSDVYSLGCILLDLFDVNSNNDMQ